MPPPPALRAVDFESRRVYQSRQRPSYTSWVSFFPGGDGRWYLTCEEVTRPEPPLPQCSPESWFAMSLPRDYDKSQHRMEAVILASHDLETWEEVSREPLRFHHTIGQFGTARTADGRFHRFVWAAYAIDGWLERNEIYFTSDDGARTWRKQPPFHDPHFCSYPHRLRTLRDGTLVLCLQLAPPFGTGQRPVRASTDLDASGEGQMTLVFSFDQGRSWQGPLPVFAGHAVSETDFVELPSGDLVLINNSIFSHPGRQVLYRDGERFTPGPLERARGRAGRGEPNLVPETVCRTPEGVFVGCMRPGRYQWSADEGRMWRQLEGIPDLGPQVYQPWIHCLSDGRIACAGHFGRDAPIRGGSVDDQYLSLHLFRLEGARPARPTRLEVVREREAGARRWRNRYHFTLRAGDEPVSGAGVEVWYVLRDEPGYEDFAHTPLEQRMAAGGHRLRLLTGADGRGTVDLSDLDAVTDPHRTLQMVASFNRDGADDRYQPCQSCQLEFHCLAEQDPPLETAPR